jgi:hypothetical protein
MTTTPLDPELAHLADLDVGFGGDSFDLAGIRSGLLELIQPPSPLQGVVGGRQVIRSSPSLSVEVFSPDTAGPHPCLLWFHGGGYVIGTAGMDALRLQAWAARFDCVTVSADYRLAPEDPFPAAHEDAMRVLGWLVERADELGIDPSRIVVAGASAGGGLAAGVGAGRPRPRHTARRPVAVLPHDRRSPTDRLEQVGSTGVAAQGERIRLARLPRGPLRRGCPAICRTRSGHRPSWPAPITADRRGGRRLLRRDGLLRIEAGSCWSPYRSAGVLRGSPRVRPDGARRTRHPGCAAGHGPLAGERLLTIRLTDAGEPVRGQRQGTDSELDMRFKHLRRPGCEARLTSLRMILSKEGEPRMRDASGEHIAVEQIDVFEFHYCPVRSGPDLQA